MPAQRGARYAIGPGREVRSFDHQWQSSACQRRPALVAWMHAEPGGGAYHWRTVWHGTVFRFRRKAVQHRSQIQSDQVVGSRGPYWLGGEIAAADVGWLRRCPRGGVLGCWRTFVACAGVPRSQHASFANRERALVAMASRSSKLLVDGAQRLDQLSREPRQGMRRVAIRPRCMNDPSGDGGSWSARPAGRISGSVRYSRRTCRLRSDAELECSVACSRSTHLCAERRVSQSQESPQLGRVECLVFRRQNL